MALDSCIPAGMTAFSVWRDLCITMSAERENDEKIVSAVIFWAVFAIVATLVRQPGAP